MVSLFTLLNFAIFPSELLSVKFFKTYCNGSYHILLGKFVRFQFIRFDDSNKLITDLYFSIQELEIIIIVTDNQNNAIVIRVLLPTITDVIILLQHCGNDQNTNLEVFPYTVTTFY